jgi:uncharacterized C2H2 Zn-finger protein
LEQICPLCNGLHRAQKLCPYCGKVMEERGALQDFIDDYSAYLDRQLGENLVQSRDCVHLYYCPSCDQDVRLNTPRLLI